ncbi:MAG: nitrous oxide reductase family maturation protein NosD [Promethearchaeota archaeon]
MNNKDRIKTILLTVGIVFGLFITNYNIFCNQADNNGVREIQNKGDLGRVKVSGSYIEPFIHVDNNWSETAVTYDWCSGDGSWGNPYIIENVTIDAGTSPTGSGILISNSKNIYFIIRNCTVYNAATGYYNGGIKLENTDDGIIINNDCSNNHHCGIMLRNNCYNNTIVANIANNNDFYGIGLSGNSNENNIRGNTVMNNGQYGMFIYFGSSNNNVSGNTVTNQFVGIYIWSDSVNNIISNNTVNSNGYGMFFQGTSNNNIATNNTVNYNSGTGIHLWENCMNNIIFKNTINYNSIGIDLDYGCDNNIITANLIKNNQDFGIDIISADCENNLIYQNSLIGTIGRHASDSGTNNQWDNSIIGNYWDNHTTPDTDNNGIVDVPYTWIVGSGASIDHFPLTENPIYFGETIHIDDTGVNALNWNTTATVKVWCSGLGTYSNPYVIEGLEIDANGIGNEILIENSNAYFIIRSCNLYNAEAAIYLNNVTNGMIIENHLSENGYGIRLDYSSYNNIVGNDLYGNAFGTGINLYYSSNNTVEGNLVENHYQGIRLDSECSENTILGNTANNNSNYGILLLYGSEYNDVTGNIVMNQSHYDGIIVYGSDHNTILENNVFDNPLYGIHLDGSSNNLLSGNVVFNNELDGITIRSEYTTFISTANNITMNTIYSNTQNGISLDDDCNVTIIWDNDIYGNDMSGIVFAHSFFDICYGNVIHDNAEMGIYVEITSENNLFYENTFIGNSINALDNGSNNNWDNGIIGNYWDDYPSVDANDDGIGDTPYIIPGNANSQDNFPIWDDGIDVIYLFVEICDQTFSEESFNFTFYIYDGINEGIDFATIQMWWNGVEVSTSIQNVGGGLYFVSLEPITVVTGEDPILLNMSIFATGYPNKYFEAYIAVDPDTLNKEGGKPAGEFPLTIIIIAIASVAVGIGVAGVSIFLLRKRKRGREIK